jgi:hypothetical protein
MSAQLAHDRFKLPLTGQEVDLQELSYEGTDLRQLRVRIRERSRFTTLDVDPVTAARWGEAMIEWARHEIARAERAADCS